MEKRGGRGSGRDGGVLRRPRGSARRHYLRQGNTRRRRLALRATLRIKGVPARVALLAHSGSRRRSKGEPSILRRLTSRSTERRFARACATSSRVRRLVDALRRGLYPPLKGCMPGRGHDERVRLSVVANRHPHGIRRGYGAKLWVRLSGLTSP